MVLHSAALTNTPAIDGMFPVVNSLEIDDVTESENPEKEDDTMDLTVEEIMELLGLSENATKEEVIKAIAEMKDSVKKLKEAEAQPEVVANSVVLGALGLDQSARTEDVVVKIMSLGNGNAEVAQMREDMKKKDAEDAVQLALTAGKITAAQKDWALQYALSDKDGFGRFVEMAPAAVPMEQIAEHQETAEQKAADSRMDVDPVILKNCGLTKEDVEKYGKQRQEG